MAEEEALDKIGLTADIVAAYVSHNQAPSSDVPALITAIYAALDQLGTGVAAEPDKPRGAVSIRKSLASPDHLISMIDGKAYKALTRHIRRHGYTPASYRTTFGLPADYPLVAPSYSEHRRTLAKAFGLGRKAAPTASAEPKRRGRKPKAVTT